MSTQLMQGSDILGNESEDQVWDELGRKDRREKN
jgi:hypothetical protein